MATSVELFARLNERTLLQSADEAFRKIENRPIKLRFDTNALGPQGLGTISRSAQEFEKSLKAAEARVLAFGATTVQIYTFVRGIKELAKATIEVEKSLKDVGVILNVSDKSLQKFGDSLFDIARNTGKSFKDISQAAAEFARQGLKLEETLDRTRDAAILSRLSNLYLIESTKALTATINSFSEAALTSTEIINKFAKVDAAFAVSSADLAEAIQRVGSSAQSSGVDIDNLVALITSVQQTTARGGAVIGNAIKSIFQRVERPEVISQLREFGIQVEDLSGTILPAQQILLNLSSVFDTLSQAQQNQATQLAAGVYQANIFKALMNDLSRGELSTYTRALRESTTATSEAIDRNKELNRTLAASLNTLSATFTQTLSTVGKSTLTPLLNLLFTGSTDILKGANNLGEGMAKGLLEGFGNFLGGPGFIIASKYLGALVVNFAKFTASALGTLNSIGTSIANQQAANQKINEILAYRPDLISRISSRTISQIELERTLLNVIREQNIARSTVTGAIGAAVANPRVRSAAISNFANPVQTAIDRETSAGVPPNLIRVGYSNKLVSQQNPLGLGVYNLRDEPRGLDQGVNRVLAAGGNPKKFRGASFIPSFVNEESIESSFFGSSFIKKFAIPEITKISEQFKKGEKTYSDLEKEAKRLTQTFKLTDRSFKSILQSFKFQFESRNRPAAQTAFGAASSRYPIPFFSRYEIPQPFAPIPYFGSYPGGTPTVEVDPIYARSGRVPLDLRGRRLRKNNLLEQQAAGIPYSTRGPSRTFNLPTSISTSNALDATRAYLGIPDEYNQKVKDILFTPRSGPSASRGVSIGDLGSGLTGLNNAQQAGFLLNRGIRNDTTLQSLISRSSGVFGTGFGPGAANARQILSKIDPVATQGILDKIASRRNQIGFGGALIAPTLAGAAAGLFDQGTKSGRIGAAAATGVGDIAAYTATGLALGGGSPVGLAVGAGFGTLIAGVRVFEQAIDDLPEFEKALGKATEQLNNANNSLSTFESTTEQINNILSGQAGKVSPEKLLNLQNQRVSSLAGIPSELRGTFIEAINSGDKDAVSNARDSISRVLQSNFITSKLSKDIVELNKNPEAGPAAGIARNILNITGSGNKTLFDLLLERPGTNLDPSGLDFGGFLSELGVNENTSQSLRSSLGRSPKASEEIFKALSFIVQSDVPKLRENKKQLDAISTNKTNELKSVLQKINFFRTAAENSSFSSLVTGQQLLSEQELGLVGSLGGIERRISEVQLFNRNPASIIILQESLAKAQNLGSYELESKKFGIQSAQTLNIGPLYSSIEERIRKSGGASKRDKELLSFLSNESSDFSKKLFGFRKRISAGELAQGEAAEFIDQTLEKVKEEYFSSMSSDTAKEIYDFFTAMSKKLEAEGLQKVEIEANFLKRTKEISEEFTRKFLEYNLENTRKGVLERFNAGAITGTESGNLLLKIANQNARDQDRSPESKIKDAGVLFKEGFAYNQTEFFQDFNEGAIETSRLIKTEFSSAFKSIASGAKDAKDAFRDFALSIATSIQGRIIDIGVNSLFGGIFSGGKKATGGLVTGGSGIKDDVVTALTGGEYVVKKSVVDRLGKDFFDTLNNSANISLINRFDYNNPTRPTAGSNAISPYLSAYALEDTNNPQNALRNSRESAFLSYLSDLNNYNENKSQALAAFEKQKRQQLIITYASAALGAASPFLSSGGKRVPPPAGSAGTVTGGFGYGNSIQYNFSPVGRASGGIVPTSLTGGEYVLNRNAASSIGINALNSINSGFTKGSSAASGGDFSNLLSRLVQSSENLNKAVGALVIPQGGNQSAPQINITNTFNIEKGEVKTQSDTKSSPDDAEKSKALSEAINATVYKTLVNELRPGGILYGAR